MTMTNIEWMRTFIEENGGIDSLKYFLKGEKGNPFYQAGFREILDSGSHKLAWIDENGYGDYIIYRWKYKDKCYQLMVYASSWDSIYWDSISINDIIEVQLVKKTIEVWEEVF